MEEDFYEEEEVPAEEVVGEVKVGEESQPPNIPPEVQVAPQESTESLQPSTGSPLPVYQLPAGDASTLMGFYSSDDIGDLEQRAWRSRNLKSASDFIAEEPDIIDNLKLFLKYTFGPQWQFKLIHSDEKVLVFQLRAYLRGYELLTSFNSRQWLRLFWAWIVSDKQEQLELLANSGGFFGVTGP